jgi:hypothetical protein
MFVVLRRLTLLVFVCCRIANGNFGAQHLFGKVNNTAVTYVCQDLVPHIC